MSIKTLFSRKKENKASLSIVLLGNGVYLYQLNKSKTPHFFEIKDNNLSLTLSQALDSLSLDGLTATITLASNHYQTYQIDKPIIPEEEWPEALPFLVKDLISEKVNEVIVSGVALPHTPRVQAYVMKKKLLTELQTVLGERSIYMLQILPEDSVWAMTKNADSAFMLLHSTNKTEFKMGAFLDGVSIFQRTIRGINSPITGESKDDFHLDTLALEAQRSIDFLSGLLKQTQINRLFLCSDSDDIDELTSELNNRLNVKVNPLFTEIELKNSGNILAIEALKLETHPSNFYAPYLQPKKDKLDFNTLASFWLATVVFMLAIYAFYYYQSSTTQTELASVKQESDQLDRSVSELEQKVKVIEPSQAKMREIENITEHIATQQRALSAIGSFDNKQLQGYSDIMLSLSSLDGANVSLSSIKIDNAEMNIQGFTSSPQEVPKWVKQFKSEDSLKQRLFKGMNISRDEDDNLIFSLHSTVGDKR